MCRLRTDPTTNTSDRWEWPSQYLSVSLFIHNVYGLRRLAGGPIVYLLPTVACNFQSWVYLAPTLYSFTYKLSFSFQIHSFLVTTLCHDKVYILIVSMVNQACQISVSMARSCMISKIKGSHWNVVIKSTYYNYYSVIRCESLNYSRVIRQQQKPCRIM